MKVVTRRSGGSNNNLPLFVLLAILIFAISVSCKIPLKNRRPTIVSFTPTPTPLYQIDPDQIPQRTIEPPMVWRTEIIQDNRIIMQSEDESFHIEKLPFTIRVTLPTNFDVNLKAFDDIDAFNAIQGNVNRDCPTPFCDAGQFAEGKPYQAPKRLIIDNDAGFHILSLTLSGGNYYRWGNAEITKDGLAFERDVSELGSQAIDQFSGNDLYLAFWVDYRDIDFINDDELKKMQIRFQE